jgi:hypothetical protein
LLALAVGLGCASSVLAEPLPFAGRWLVDDHPDVQLRIKDATLSWREPGSPAPGCVRPFEVKQERPGTVYTDGRGKKFVAGVPGSIPTYLLKLGAGLGACASPAEEARIIFPLIYDTGHIELIEYVAGRPVSVRRLHRKK